MSLEQVCQTLRRSKEPSVRWMVRVHVLEENPRSKRIQGLGRQIRLCPRVRTLLAHRDSRGRLRPVGNPYSKWQGAHWVLATLADIGYPRADRSLFAMRDQVLDRWLADTYYHEFDAKTEAEAYRGVVCRGSGDGIGDVLPNRGMRSTSSRNLVSRMGARTPSSSDYYIGRCPTAAGIATSTPAPTHPRSGNPATRCSGLRFIRPGRRITRRGKRRRAPRKYS